MTIMLTKGFIAALLLTCLSTNCNAQETQDKFIPTQEELDKYLPQLTIGDTIPELKAKAPDGTTLDIKQMRGSYVVIDFWASWCGDCRREIPGLKALYADSQDIKPGGHDILWLGFSFDYNVDAWLKMIEKEQMPWPQISNLKKTREDPTFKNWQLRWIPAFFVVSPEGIIVGTAITADGLRDVINRLANN